MENITPVQSKIALPDEEITNKYAAELHAKERRIGFAKDGRVEEQPAPSAENINR